MGALANMRDRRNTNLSTSSIFSNDSSLSGASRTSLNEKRVLTPPPIYSNLAEPTTKENHSRPSTPARFPSTLRLIITIFAIAALWYVVLSEAFGPLSTYLPGPRPLPAITPSDSESIPPGLSAFKALDAQGSPKWTVHIPLNYSFPLEGQHAKEICQQSESLRDDLSRQSRMMAVKDWRRQGGYYFADTTFLEVGIAESIGVLPPVDAEMGGKICEKSLTLALDVQDTSFGKSLLMLWLSYGLAQKEGRAFFVDDTRWLYGRYTSFFAPPPAADCMRPPPHHIVPCPHNAKHLLVSSATVPWTFGSSFEREFSQTWKSGVDKSKRIYDLLRTGYEDLFHLAGDHASYSAARIAKFKEDATRLGSSTVGIHLRRGDLHPFEYQFSQDYLPLERYGAAARKLREQCDVHGSAATQQGTESPLLLATDDPEMFDSAELQHSAAPYGIQKSQERIQLATKATLDLSSPAEPVVEPGSVYTKHVVENSGWEGGFYSALFYALGKPNSKAGDSAADEASSTASGSRANGVYDGLFSEQAMQMRELVGRAYLLDLAVLGESDGIVCASSSATCRVLGVMLGWERVKSGRWVNVDDNRIWTWDGRR